MKKPPGTDLPGGFSYCVLNAGIGRCSCRELAEHAEVVFEEQPDIVYFVTQQHRSVHPHAESVAGPCLGIDSAVAHHVGMNHAAAHDFKPSGFFADPAPLTSAEIAGDIYLRGWFGEREEARSETKPDIFAEHLASKGVDRGLKVGERDVPVDIKAL